LRRIAAEKAELEWIEKKRDLERREVEEKELETKREMLEKLRRDQEEQAEEERRMIAEQTEKMREQEELLKVCVLFVVRGCSLNSLFPSLRCSYKMNTTTKMQRESLRK